MPYLGFPNCDLMFMPYLGFPNCDLFCFDEVGVAYKPMVFLEIFDFALDISGWFGFHLPF